MPHQLAILTGWPIELCPDETDEYHLTVEVIGGQLYDLTVIRTYGFTANQV